MQFFKETIHAPQRITQKGRRKSTTASRYTSANNKLIPADVKPADAKPEIVKPAVVKPPEVKPQPSPVANASSIDRATITAHVAALRNNDADFARDAALALGALADAAAVEPLIQAIGNSDGFYHSVVRAAAATSLAKIGDSRAVMPLIAAVRDSVAEPSVEAIRRSWASLRMSAPSPCSSKSFAIPMDISLRLRKSRRHRPGEFQRRSPRR